MYIVTIKNGTTLTEIQNENHKLFAGSIVKGINAIDSFTFSLLPDNPGFGALKDFTTLVDVYNTKQRRYEFRGRVLCTSPQMDNKGLITQEATCENYFGFLCDSQQEYVEEKKWTVYNLLKHIISTHNAQVEEYKQFQVGATDADFLNQEIVIDIQRENSWDTIKKKLLDQVGGEIRFYISQNGNLTIDYAKEWGEAKTTEIALSKNMRSIIKEKDPSSFITRLIPLGAKESDNSEERVDITSVNGGKNYIDDTEAIKEYGIHVGHVEFDDVTEPSNLKKKAEDWLKENNKVSIKYSITALDLSLIDLDIDDFEVCNTYPIKNKLLGIDDTARIHKKTIDVCDETKTTIEIGESFKSLSELQREQMVSINKVQENIADIVRNYVTNQKFTTEISKTVSLIEQTEKTILLSVSETYVSSADLSEEIESKVAIAVDNIDMSVYAKTTDIPNRNLLLGTETPIIVYSMGSPNGKTRCDLSIPLEAGQVYTFSCDYENLEGVATLMNLGKGWTYVTAFDINDGKMSHTFTTVKEDEGAQFIELILGDIDCSIKVSNMKLEKGPLATAWSLAPEEDFLSDYTTTTEMEAKISVAVEDAISRINMSTYATKKELNQTVLDVNSSLELYATTDELQSAISGINLSAYATKDGLEKVEAKLSLAVLTDAEGNLTSQIHIGANKLTIDTDNFCLDSEGTLSCLCSVVDSNPELGDYQAKIEMNAVGITYYIKSELFGDDEWHQWEQVWWGKLMRVINHSSHNDI